MAGAPVEFRSRSTNITAITSAIARFADAVQIMHNAPPAASVTNHYADLFKEEADNILSLDPTPRVSGTRSSTTESAANTVVLAAHALKPFAERLGLGDTWSEHAWDMETTDANYEVGNGIFISVLIETFLASRDQVGVDSASLTCGWLLSHWLEWGVRYLVSQRFM